jgi:hypothetical protein
LGKSLIVPLSTNETSIFCARASLSLVKTGRLTVSVYVCVLLQDILRRYREEQFSEKQEMGYLKNYFRNKNKKSKKAEAWPLTMPMLCLFYFRKSAPYGNALICYLIAYSV